MSSDRNPRRSRKLRSEKRADLRPSWSWLAIPLLIIGVVAGIWWGLYSPSESPEEPVLTPTPTRIQRPQPSPTATMAVLFHTPTIAPSPIATVVTEIGAGINVKVVNTDGAGLNMRVAAGSNHDLVTTVGDGEILKVLAGPMEADGHKWWQVRDSEDNIGWVAGEWLELSLP
ncbi:MAG: SH3 domain-containing protein [Chloroflexota bacterium]